MDSIATTVPKFWSKNIVNIFLASSRIIRTFAMRQYLKISQCQLKLHHYKLMPGLSVGLGAVAGSYIRLRRAVLCLSLPFLHNLNTATLTPKKSYGELLNNPLWQRKRLEIFNRDNFTCTLCGDQRAMLAIHHLSYSGKPWEAQDDQLRTVCHHCHTAIHAIPNHVIERANKCQTIGLQCWEIVAYTDKGIVFMYLFYTNEKTEVVTVFTNDLKMAA